MTKIQQAISAHQKNDIQTAKQLYADILQLEPENPQALHYYGVIESENNQINSGLSFMEKALALKPDNPIFNHNIAGLYSRVGRIKKAIKHFKRAIQLKPDYGEAYQGLTESMSCTNEWALLESIEQQLKLDSISAIQKSYLHFSAGKICADSQNYESAFSHYQKANQLKNVDFDVEKIKQETQLKIQFFNNDWVLAKKEFGLYDHTPIFMVGMPRSGSTLTEQILSSHSSVFGAGELNGIASIIKSLQERTKSKYPDPLFLLEASGPDLLGYAFSYIRELSLLSNNTARVVDKHPLNFKHIGLILLMFPNAKIIHTKRDPLDTCLSCYFQNFSKGQDYSFNLEHLAAFYNHYQALMNHWQMLFPGKIYSLSYESLISQQENVTRDLLNFCELEWQNDCLLFHKNKRNVTTASKIQVRQPLYKNSLKRWKHYETHLQDLITALQFKI